jgi:hypothetical protein
VFGPHLNAMLIFIYFPIILLESRPTVSFPVWTPSPVLVVCRFSLVLVVSRFFALVSLGLGFWSCYFVFFK